MKYIILGFLFLFAMTAVGQVDSARSIRIVDSLSALEKSERKPVLLRSELDSLVRLYESNRPGVQPGETVSKKETGLSEYLLWATIALLGTVIVLLWLLFSKQRKFHETVYLLGRQVKNLELAAFSWGANDAGSTNKPRIKAMANGLEKKVQALTTQLEKVTSHNEKLEHSLKEYADSKLDFESVKQQMMEVYKIRNYPGFNKEKSETEIVKALLETERSVALYAYEHFLKPVLAIADANKNNPARINQDDHAKMLDLLISLSLFYSEYLYLRINDLSIGGKIVERIGNLRNGNHVDPASLKELNVEHGSRALVLRMVLDKSNVQHLSYPVFDETNLNLS